MFSLPGLRPAFERRFGTATDVRLARAPGRVNLIGDHTDYNGLPVLPMAIQCQVQLLFRPRSDSTVRLVNRDAAFPERSFELAPTIPPHPAGDWVNYVKAAGQALAEWRSPLRGFDAAVASTIPAASGLSSSSALVVASALALLHVNGLRREARPLMELLARGERYVGVQGGGMDQAICLGGQRDMAFKIEFEPLRLTAIRVPEAWRFVVASSLVAASKAGNVRAAYNQRTHECREALAVVSGHLDAVEPVRSYAEAMAARSLAALATLADAALTDPHRRRFRHVITEAARVEAAQAAMETGDLARFGRLMRGSHRSLRDDFEVSCRALDELVEVAAAAGAAGARLTGAGFGGAIVALCTAERSTDVVAAIDREFYAPRGLRDPGMEHRLVAKPSEGASLLSADRLSWRAD